MDRINRLSRRGVHSRLAMTAITVGVRGFEYAPQYGKTKQSGN
jgi:hypothetical protein